MTDDPFAAYCLDNAVGEFGRTVDAELNRVEAKTNKELDVKAERVLRKWLGMPQRYRDPVKSGKAPAIPTKSEEV